MDDVAGAYVTDNGFKLGDWLHSQRRMYARGNYRQDRKEKLDKLNMVWKKKGRKKMPTVSSASYTGISDHTPISATPKTIY